MAQTDEERQASNVDALTAPEQATPGAAVLRRRPVLDSGATIHVFSDGCLLRNIRYLPSPRVIRVADGRPVYADVVGDIDTEDIKLKNVYLATHLKLDLVSVRELAKAGITTTFYKNHAELRKGAEVVGGAIAKGDTSLYELTYLLATGDDASDTTPEVPSGSEPWRVAAVNGINLPHLEEVVDYDFNNPAGDDFWLIKKSLDDFTVAYGYVQRKWIENPSLLSEHKGYLWSEHKSLDDAAVYSAYLKPKYIQYSSLVSKFYQSDKTGGGVCCNNKVRDGSVHVKAHMGPDPDGMHEADLMKSPKDYNS